MKLNSFILFVLLAASVFAQDPEKAIEYNIETSILYYDQDIAKNDQYMQEMCVFDFYYPTNITNFPTIVWFHGGGLTGGKRFIPDYLKEKGLAIIGVGNRLSPNVQAVECIRDAAAATAWAFNHIEDYGGNRNLIFVSGMSAGGYLAYMIGLDKEY